MRQRTMLAWSFVHKWTSLVCTAFLFVLCVTGLPLIFHEEIDHALSPRAPLPSVPAGTPAPSLDTLLADVATRFPAERPLYLSFDDDRPVANVTTAPRVDSRATLMHFSTVDRRTGRVMPPAPPGVMDFILRIHTDLLLGLPAELVLGGMGLLLVVAIVSGVVLYPQFMARLMFGTVRHDRSARVRRLDRHNLLGVLTAAWGVVVGLTGTMNTLAVPLTQLWQANQPAALAEPAGGAPAPLRTSVARAAVAALRAVPGTRIQFIAFPGVAYTSRAHLAVYLQGDTPLTRRLLTPVFIDAGSGRIDAIGHLPWYMAALLLSEPLHFGDYGGLPMKLVWMLLDLLTIVVLWTGLRLWIGRRARPARAQAGAGVGAKLVPGA